EQVVGDGDLTLTIAASTYQDPRPLGVLIERVSVSPTKVSAGLRGALPPWSLLVPALVVALCLYGSLCWLKIDARAAAGASLAVAALGAWALVAYRYPMVFYMQPLALLMVFGALLLPPLDWSSDWLFRRLGVPLAPWLRRALLLTFMV